MQTFLNMFPLQASTHAAEVDHMTILVHWLMLVLFIGWGLFFLFVLFRFRKGREPQGELYGRAWEVRQVHGSGRGVDRDRTAGLLRHPGVGDARQGVSVRERRGSRRCPRGGPSICLGDSVSRSRREVRRTDPKAGDGGQ